MLNRRPYARGETDLRHARRTRYVLRVGSRPCPVPNAGGTAGPVFEQLDPVPEYNFVCIPGRDFLMPESGMHTETKIHL